MSLQRIWKKTRPHKVDCAGGSTWTAAWGRAAPPTGRKPLPWLAAALVAALAAACGGRSVGVPFDGSGTEAGLPDAATVPDGQVDAGASGCVVPSEPVIIANPVEPCFAYSLDRMADDRYVLGGATGWPGAGGVRAALWVLGPDLEPQGTTPVSAEMVLARYDRFNHEIVAVAEKNNEVRLLRYTLTAAGPELEGETFLCSNCYPAWSSPVVGAESSAAAVRDLGNSGLYVYIIARGGSGDMMVHGPLEGERPGLAPGTDGPILLYSSEAALWAQPFDWANVSSSPPMEITTGPTMGLLAAEGSDLGAGPTTAGSWAAALLDDGEEPTFLLLGGVDGSSPQTRGNVTGVVSYPAQMDISLGQQTVGVAWGVTFGNPDVGAFSMAFDTTGTQPIFGPALISEPVSSSSSSFSIWAVAASHGEGHAVVWGAWQEGTYHGLYGKILRCSAR